MENSPALILSEFNSDFGIPRFMTVQRLVFIWENFGPQHHDRLEAVAEHFGASVDIVAIELSKKSSVYKWGHRLSSHFQHHILCHDEPHFFDRSLFSQLYRLVPIALRQGPAHFALCHYEQPAIFILACLLRLLRRRVIIMNDSKFDDYDRHIGREILKWFLYRPYRGAMVASYRAAAYVCFLGIKRNHIKLNYDNLSRERIWSLVEQNFGSDIQDFSERDFIVIARLVEKKNLFRTLDAYARYRQLVPQPRRLVICGYGELEQDLKRHAQKLNISDAVEFTGYLPIETIAGRLARSLALLLLSTEEQFGQVVLEAQALRIPVIVSSAVGAVDCFVRNGVNGFIVDAYDIENIAQSMMRLGDDHNQWIRMTHASDLFSERGDARHFASSLDELMRSL